MANYYGSICLTDIPMELITEGKNGKKYLNIVINERKEVSQYGMTHYVKAYCKKENKREGVNYYIGEVKPSSYQGGSGDNETNVHRNYTKGNQQTNPFTSPVSDPNKDLPF